MGAKFKATNSVSHQSCHWKKCSSSKCQNFGRKCKIVTLRRTRNKIASFLMRLSELDLDRRRKSGPLKVESYDNSERM